MTNVENELGNSLLLPQLKDDRDIRADRIGAWTLHPTAAFQRIAAGLDYQAPGELNSVSSVPTMWAHPLTVEMALHNPGHPIREQMVGQWRGMLAAIALASVLGHPLKAKRIQVGKLGYHPFDRALNRLVPDAFNALYDHRQTGDKHPWRDLFVFFWGDNPVGMTSPSTIVVPGEAANWGSLRWYNPTSKRLYSPQKSELNEDDRTQLWLWLQNLQNALTAPDLGGNGQAVNTIVRLLDEFKADLLNAPPQEALALSSDREFFGIPLNRGILRTLSKPIKAAAKDSSVAIVPSEGKTPEKPLILIDPEIAKRWGKEPEDIYVYQDKTLAKINLEAIDQYRFQWKDEVNCATPDDLFLADLKFIDHVAEAIPGGLMPKSTQPLVFAGEHITALIPLNSLLLEYFTPEELVDLMTLKPLNEGESSKVEVSLDLPLSGTDKLGKSENYRLTREYELTQENALTAIPVLELWPNFKAKDWQAYYALFFDLGAGNQTFRVRFTGQTEVVPYKDDQGANYILTQLYEFPTVIECLDDANQLIGLILPKQPPEVFPKANWKVGVDFGTSFTNIYVGRSGRAEPLELDEELHLKVTKSPLNNRFPTLLHFFVPERFLPPERPLPLSTVLTTRASSLPKGKGERAILDGRIFNPNLRDFNPQEDWIETDLKWKNFDHHRLFLKHLILHISANAVKQGIANIHWMLSYPSAFSRNDRSMYAATWNDLTEALGRDTGIHSQCSSNPNSEYFKTESLAIAQYFADQERLDMVYSTCIDMGGGTSDISIWQDNELVHQCSVKFAGRDLLSNFLELKPTFVATHFERDPREWSKLRGGDFHAKLDVLLRWESEAWLQKKRPTLTDADDFQGLVRLMALGVCGLYYYVGLIIQCLKENGTYRRDVITPVYLGGNGSRLLHWLDITGRFSTHGEMNLLLSRILSRGANLDDSQENTRLSGHPKDEVACGLVLAETDLKGLDPRSPDSLIPGEDYELNGMSYGWDRIMDIEEDITSFSIPKLDHLSEFLYEFHKGLKDFRIEGIRPIPGYTPSTDISVNPKLWQGTQRSLDKLLRESKLTGDITKIQMQPPFILGLKALLHHLGNQWSGR
ncbi:MAG: hypothetical protein AAGD25_11245 [Cyanobacteria bacterium P01_F01_bin.150]